jgi:hypothetical protein
MAQLIVTAISCFQRVSEVMKRIMFVMPEKSVSGVANRRVLPHQVDNRCSHERVVIQNGFL